MKDNILPEERLLRLIRGQNKRVPLLVEGDLNVPVSMKIPDGACHQRRAFKFEKYLPQLNANILIIIGLVVSSLYLLSTFVYPLFVSQKTYFLQEKPFEKMIVLKEEIKPFDFYTQGIKSKQIFGVASAQLTQESNVAVGVNLIKDINLLGVISGDNPQAIIEDKKSQKTCYLTKGQMIGEFQVEYIGEGKIILNYSGQKFELNI